MDRAKLCIPVSELLSLILNGPAVTYSLNSSTTTVHACAMRGDSWLKCHVLTNISSGSMSAWGDTTNGIPQRLLLGPVNTSTSDLDTRIENTPSMSVIGTNVHDGTKSSF